MRFKLTQSHSQDDGLTFFQKLIRWMYIEWVVIPIAKEAGEYEWMERKMDKSIEIQQAMREKQFSDLH